MNVIYNSIYNEFIDVFCNSLGMNRKEVFKKIRDNEHVTLRYPIFYVLRLQGLTYKEISNICLHSDLKSDMYDDIKIHHTTVKHGFHTVENEIEIYKNKIGLYVDLANKILAEIIKKHKNILSVESESISISAEKEKLSLLESEFIENVATIIENTAGVE